MAVRGPERMGALMGGVNLPISVHGYIGMCAVSLISNPALPSGLGRTRAFP